MKNVRGKDKQRIKRFYKKARLNRAFYLNYFLGILSFGIMYTSVRSM